MPRTTLSANVKQFEPLAAKHSIPLRQATHKKVIAVAHGGRKSLLDGRKVEHLASAIICWDGANDGILRKEVIAFITKMTECSHQKTAEDFRELL